MYKKGNEDKNDDSKYKEAAIAVVDVFCDELEDLSRNANEEKKSENNLRRITTVADVNDFKEKHDQEQIIDIEIQRITLDLGKKLDFVKLPKYSSVESKSTSIKSGIDPKYYQSKTANSVVSDEGVKSRVKLNVDKIIHWRYGKNEIT